MTSRTQCRDELNAIVRDNLSVDKILWPDVLEEPPSSGSWARVVIIHEDNRQVTFGEVRRWRTFGCLHIQIFTPLGDGLSLSDALAIEVCSSLRGVTTASGVLVRGANAREIGSDGAFYQTNVVADFEFDELE